MFRPHNESRMYESNYHEQNPFFRETITIIDQCTKLMKDDRIFLRNKIKDYLKDLKQNRQKEDDWENQQMQILLQIFIQGNKKKSLNKIQKGDKVMDWLQIKLRKFIDNNKKERHRKDVESFRRIKGLNLKKQIEPHLSFDQSLEKSRGLPVYNGPKFADQVNKLSFNVEPRKKKTLPKYSLSKSNEKSPDYSRKKIAQIEPFSNISFYKQFDYLKKAQSKQQQEPIRQTSSSFLKNKYLRNETRPISSQLTKFNCSLDRHKYTEKSFDRKGNSRSRQKDDIYPIKSKKIKQIQMPKQLTKQELDNLTELFTHHLNSQEKYKKNTSNNTFQSHFRYPQSSKPNEEFPHYRLTSELSSQRQATILNNSSRYEASTKKIQEMLRNSKQILHQYQQQHESKQQSSQPLPSRNQTTFPKNSSNEDLFTPPDFLAECRKYMFSSNKKKTEQDVPDKYNEPYKQTNFSDLLYESKQKTNEKIYKFNSYGINEVVSENASANLSINKPESQVNFKFKNYSITSVEALLLQIFKYSNKAILDGFQLGQIMSKSNPQTEQLFQKYCDVLSLQSVSYNQKLSFDFVSVIKYFYTLEKILQPNKQYFCIFLSQILDIRKKGYIDEDDIQNFFESLQSSDLDQATLNTIHNLLYRVFKDGCQIEGGNMMTHWSIYYIELKGDQSLLSLKELLNKFQFQLDQQNDQ